MSDMGKMKPYKKRYVPLVSTDLWARETKKYPWSRWEITRGPSGEIITFRKIGDRFDHEWKYTKSYYREIITL